MTRFTALDAVVLVLYLAGTTALGLYVGRTQRDSNDYFVAERSIHGRQAEPIGAHL